MDEYNKLSFKDKDNDLVCTENGQLLFNPFNPCNIEITHEDVCAILRKYNIPPQITNFHLYKRAFIHSSYTKRPEYENQQQKITIVPKPDNCLPLSTKSNERLEYLGDGVLECVTKYLIYRRFPKCNEGFMTNKKIAMVQNEAIGKIALEMGLHKWLILSRNAEEKKIRMNLKKLGCLFEAFIGAVFLDFNKIVVQDEKGWFQNEFVTGPGFQMAQKFIESVFEKHIDWVNLILNDDNYKNILQVKIQKEFKVTPHYIQMGFTAEEGFQMGVFLCVGFPHHSLGTEQHIHINEFSNFKSIQEHIARHKKIFLYLGEGLHKIKKKAEQIACCQALTVIESF